MKITKFKKNGKSLIQNCEASRQALGQYPDAILAHESMDFLDKEFYSSLKNLKKSRSIKWIGVSVYSEEEIKNVLNFNKPDVVQCPLNILDTRLYRKNILDELKSHDIQTHVRSVFLQGLLYLNNTILRENFNDAFQVINQLKKVAKKYALTLGELSLLWVCSLNQVDKVIIGIDSVEQLESNITTFQKSVDPMVFEEALSIIYENEEILNPSRWPAR